MMQRYRTSDFILTLSISFLVGEAAKITTAHSHAFAQFEEEFDRQKHERESHSIVDNLGAISLLEPSTPTPCAISEDLSHSMSSFIETMRSVSEKRRHPRKVVKRPHPLAWEHKKGLWHWHHSDYVCLASFTLVAVMLNTLHSYGKGDDLKHSILFLILMAGLSAIYCFTVRHLRSETDAEAWLTGYILESSLSVDDVFVFHIVFTAFAVPEDQAHFVLSAAIYAAIILRAAFVAFFAALFQISYAVNVAVGVVLIMGAALTILGNPEKLEVKDLFAVRFFKWLLGSRLRDRYGANGQPFEWSDKGFLHCNVLFLVVCALVVVDAFSALDAIGSKTEEIDDTYINMSSSFMTMFTLRPLFFVIRGLASQCELVKYGIAAILAFVGIQMIVMKWYPISLGWLATIIVIIFSSSVAFSFLMYWLRGGKQSRPHIKEEVCCCRESKTMDEEQVFEDQIHVVTSNCEEPPNIL